MNWDKRQAVVMGGLLVIGLVIALGFLILHKNQAKQPEAQNFNTISDSSTGLSFNMSKSFKPIPKTELAAMNPGFTYGFVAENDTQAVCIVSPTTLTKGGTITPEQLRDGILSEVKKVHPDTTLDNAATAANWAQFGNGQGVLLQLTYGDGTTKIKRVEIIALGKSKAVQVTAYCQSPATDNQRYYTAFTIFFSSLKLAE